LFVDSHWTLEKDDAWEIACNAYDVIGKMIISVTWSLRRHWVSSGAGLTRGPRRSYIAPLAELPSRGCPGDGCWAYCRAIAMYAGAGAVRRV
jgi:hypothetical protein